MRAFIIMLCCAITIVIWFFITSHKMDRGLIVTSPHLGGELAIRTLDGSLSIAHWPRPGVVFWGMKVYPYSHEDNNTWGGGTFFHYRRILYPGYYYSELRFSILATALPFLLALVYLSLRVRKPKNKIIN